MKGWFKSRVQQASHQQAFLVTSFNACPLGLQVTRMLAQQG